MNISEKLRMSDYIASTGCAIEDIRLLVEGAVYLYSEEIAPLFKMAKTNEQHMAAQSLSTIGSALYLLQKHALKMQQAYTEEFGQQMVDEESPL